MARQQRKMEGDENQRRKAAREARGERPRPGNRAVDPKRTDRWE